MYKPIRLKLIITILLLQSILKGIFKLNYRISSYVY